jgi:predicted acetyltransferase
MSPARSLRPPPLRYRAARRTDVETLADLGMRAYRVSSLEQRREFYTDHPRFGLRDVRVGELDGQVVASLVLYSFTSYVRGQRVPLTGIGSVAVSPEQRRRGVGEALMRAALREARQEGRALLALYPFRASYYGRLGFGTIEVVQELAIAPGNLQASDEARFTRRLMLPDRPAVQALFERVVAAQGHFALTRSVEWWNRRLWTYPGDWIVYEGRRRGQIEGYLYYEIDSSHGPFRLALALNEFVAATPEAHRGLVGYLRSLSDQVQEIHYAAPGDNGWLAMLKTSQNLRPGAEIGLFHDTGNVAHGVMLRLTDPKLALESLPAAPGSRGELLLEVDDPVLPVNSRGYRVAVRDGKFKVTFQSARRGPRARLPRLVVDAEALGPLIAGAWSPTRATEMGLIRSVHGGAEVAENWFRARPAFLYQMNAF